VRGVERTTQRSLEVQITLGTLHWSSCSFGRLSNASRCTQRPHDAGCGCPARHHDSQRRGVRRGALLGRSGDPRSRCVLLAVSILSSERARRTSISLTMSLVPFDEGVRRRTEQRRSDAEDLMIRRRCVTNPRRSISSGSSGAKKLANPSLRRWPTNRSAVRFHGDGALLWAGSGISRADGSAGSYGAQAWRRVGRGGPGVGGLGLARGYEDRWREGSAAESRITI